jgi:hypothetical protein
VKGEFMGDYILYLDEANKNSTNPFFCLAGIVIRRDEYENSLIPKVNDLKDKYFSTTSIVFHYTEMKKNINEFKMFIDQNQRANFWQDFNKMLSLIDFTTLGVYFDAENFKSAYRVKHNKHYNYAFINLLNNYMTFLRYKNQSMGSIVFESRQWNENAEIQRCFMHMLECGTDIYSAKECNELLSTLSFFTKKDNCAGLQIADFVPDSFIRELNGSKNFYNVKAIFLERLFGIEQNQQTTLGLKAL